MHRVLHRKRVLATSASLLLCTCSGGATSDLGLSGLLRVADAQFVAGQTPAEDTGPRVESLEFATTNIWPGYRAKPLRGSAGSAATAVTLELLGDRGYWILRTGAADNGAPTFPTFRAEISFASELTLGRHQLEMRAVDAAGHFGPTRRQVLNAGSGPAGSSKPAALSVTLTWDTESDIDLHVIDPLGNEVYHGAPTSLDGFTPNANRDTSYGTLDADANADCRIDGRRRETVAWTAPPPSGHYLARVDAKSLCGEAIAHFRLEVVHERSIVAAVSGVSLDTDTQGPHDRGSGVLALSFDIP